MDYQEFKQLLMDELREVKPSEVREYKLQTVVRHNDNQSDCVTPIFQDSNLSPAIYLEHYYDAAMTKSDIKTLAADITKTMLNAFTMQSNFDISQITPENATEHLILRMVNRELNQEIAKTTAHIDCMDLMAVPRWEVGIGDAKGSFLVNREIQRTMLHMTDDELLQIARSNTRMQMFTVQGVNSVLKSMLNEVPEEVVSEVMPTDGSEVLYVMTNAEKEYGATALLFPEEMQKVSAVIKEQSFYVIPSSVHELIIVPSSNVGNPADLLEMMKTINGDTVSREDWLGVDNIYRFDGHKLNICNTQEEAIAQTAPLHPENRAVTQRRTL